MSVLLCGAFFLSACTTPVHKKTFIVSGTYLTVTSPDARAASFVYEEWRRLDKIFNTYDKNSEISRLNAASPYTAVRVSPELFELIDLARQVYILTGGCFDVSQGRLYQFWKSYISRAQKAVFPSAEAIASYINRNGMECVQLDDKARTVTITSSGVTLDVSGIAKGYIVDKVITRLKAEGIESALVDAGGDIYCLGKDNDTPWQVGIREPVLQEGIVDVVPIVNEAVATSGDYEQFFEYQEKRYSHLIDPRSGYPVNNNIMSVTVITQNCTSADSLATALFIMGIDEIRSFFKNVPSTMRVFVVAREGKESKLYVFR